MKTLKENSFKATNLILAAIPFIAAEDWTDTIKSLEVCVVKLSFSPALSKASLH